MVVIEDLWKEDERMFLKKNLSDFIINLNIIIE